MSKPTTPEVGRTVTRMQLSGRDIIRLVVAVRKNFKATKDTRVLFHVPGGGDWSNTTIEIDRECPITVTSGSDLDAVRRRR